MTRRIIGLLVTLALSLLVVPLAVTAPPAGKIYRIGLLAGHSQAPREQHAYAAFQQGLRDLRYVEGTNVILESRYTEGHVDIIVAAGAGYAGVLAAKQATTTIPIVMVGMATDSVETGLVESLAHPGGTITGLINLASETAGKRLELFKATVPTLVRVAVLYDPANRGNVLHVAEVQKAARALGLTMQLWEVQGTDDFERVFAALREERPDGLYVPGGPLTRGNETRIVAMTVKSGIPSAHDSREAVEAGGLMSYAYAIGAQYRRGL